MTDCSCLDVYGEDPRCIKHGRGTPWGKANPDICALAEKAARVDELEQRIRAEGVGSIAQLQKALVDHNDALRSAAQVAGRDGKDTNWLTFRGHVHWILAEHHEIANAARDALSTPAAEPAGEKVDKREKVAKIIHDWPAHRDTTWETLVGRERSVLLSLADKILAAISTPEAGAV